MHIRERMANLGKETVEIVKKGYYRNESGNNVVIHNEVKHSVENTVLYSPEDGDGVVKNLAPRPAVQTILEVKNMTTLHAAKDLLDEGYQKVVALNFASARHPGGGFLKGALAQEESLARSSALYETLISKPEMYEENTKNKSGLYSDYMIYSPDVPVFRHDMGNLLNNPYLLSFITSPAVNVGYIEDAKQKISDQEIHETMTKRIEKILAIGLHHGYEAIVLGAFGCGVFRNNPVDVAAYFKDALGKNPKFHHQYKKIIFAVLDTNPKKPIFKPFKYILE